MPYQIKHAPGQGIAIMGLVEPGEIEQFRQDIDVAIRELVGANWNVPFRHALTHIGTHKTEIIKFWRHISKQSLADSKRFIDLIDAGEAPPPAGSEYPDIDAYDLREIKTWFPDGAPVGAMGNWRDQFIDCVCMAQRWGPGGVDNTLGVPDPYGFHPLAVKFWRSVSGKGFTDAREYVNSLITGKVDWPEGNEYPAVSDDVLGEFSRDYTQAMNLIN